MWRGRSRWQTGRATHKKPSQGLQAKEAKRLRYMRRGHERASPTESHCIIGNDVSKICDGDPSRALVQRQGDSALHLNNARRPQVVQTASYFPRSPEPPAARVFCMRFHRLRVQDRRVLARAITLGKTTLGPSGSKPPVAPWDVQSSRSGPTESITTTLAPPAQ